MPTNKNLSREPVAVRQRMRRRNLRTMDDMKILADARKPLEEWDMEELARGRPRDANGGFSGAPPKWITPVVTMEAKRRLQLGALGELGTMVGNAIRVVYDMMMNDSTDDNGRPIVDAKTRLSCAMFIINHVLGTPKQRVDIEGGSQFKHILASALVVRDERGQMVQAHPVVDLADDEWMDNEDE